MGAALLAEDELNAEQRAAAEHDAAAGALLVVAGAGTGKTATLCARAARLVERGTDPQRLLLVTFSRRAAQQMQQRVGRLLQQRLGLATGLPPPRLLWCGTFHAVAARLLREEAPRIGLSPGYTVLDRGDSEDLIGIVRQQLGFAAHRQRFPLPATCLAIHSRCVNAARPLAEVLRHDYPWCQPLHAELTALFDAYGEAKRAQQSLDYDDLLLAWRLLLREPATAARLRARFDQVLVDEAQDMNRLQMDIVAALAPDGRGLTLVGDDAQAIYGFRGADVRHMLEFPARFDPPAEVVTLSRNYRSHDALLAASNAVIALAGRGFAKRLWSGRAGSARPALHVVIDDAAQAQGVADAVLATRECGIALKRQAVLFRAAHHSAALELELARRRIPFVKYGGLRFVESAHVKDVLAVLRWADNPHAALAAWRVARLVPGVGPASARRLLDGAAEVERFAPPAGAAAEWASLRELLAHLRGGAARWPDDLHRAVAWYRPHLQRLHDDARIRALDLEQLAALAPAYGSRERFLTEIALDPPAASSDEAGPPGRDEDYLILSTIHSAKGQEWHAVHVLNVVDGCLPADMAAGSADELDEERRLLYVAMTRARETLTLWVPQRFHVTQQPYGGRGDRHVYALRSRFIPDEIVDRFECAVAAVEAGTRADDSVRAPPLFDLMERLRSGPA